MRPKQSELDIQDLRGLLQVRLQLGTVQLHSAFYTRVDQALLLWSSIAIAIFATAQFSPLSWVFQAYLWTALTITGTIIVATLTRFWARVEQLSWVVRMWGLLTISGVVLTDLGIFLGWGIVLMNLCPLWFGIVALGYFFTGIGLRSRTFLGIGSIHLLAISLLPLVLGWQFLFTGLVIGGSLVLLSELQWDMRPPVESPTLSASERQFNRQQHHRRQASV
ncbi:hypothetical protein [Rubidibacter lacunae]|uniref:hypothetical protein n=1 Tax=Rubidibacter lacunae TaxID=582514 RepID=UPI0003F5724A|nr:hypothetical protein [Rubidibacter lacunae]